jgi:proteasome activator subunit 4
MQLSENVLPTHLLQHLLPPSHKLLAKVPSEIPLSSAQVLENDAALIAPSVEGRALLTALLADVKIAVEKSDYGLACYQSKRINTLTSLKFSLPYDQWKEIVTGLFKLAFSEGVSWPRQNKLFAMLRSLLSFSPSPRPTILLAIEWRPFYSLLQSTFLSHLSVTTQCASTYYSSQLRHVVKLAMSSRTFFPTGAAAEIALCVEPSLLQTNTKAMFAAQTLLYIFLPPATSVADLPPGTVQKWIRIWAMIDHCAHWNAIWTVIFCRLAHHEAISDVDDYIGAEGVYSSSAAFPWGSHVPFFVSKLQEMLNVPLGNGKPMDKAYPAEFKELLAGSDPDGVEFMTELLTRIMTCKIPAFISNIMGDKDTLIGDTSVMGNLERLLRALSSFFYPTSASNRTFMSFLRKLTSNFCQEFGRQSGSATAKKMLSQAGLPIPLHSTQSVRAVPISVGKDGSLPAISDQLATRFVNAVLPLAILGLYAQKGASSVLHDAIRILKLLAELAPARVTTELVSMALIALDPTSVDQPHTAPNALEALAALVPSLLFPIPHISPSLPDLLHLSLPGIDPNDTNKTIKTIMFFASVAGVIPFIDSDDIISSSDAASDELSLPVWHPASKSFTGVPVGATIPPALVGKLAIAAGGAVKLGIKIASASGLADVDPLSGKHITVAAAGSSEEDDVMSNNSVTEKPAHAVCSLFYASRDSGSRISEWALLLVERLLKVLEVREKSDKKNSNEGILGAYLYNIFLLLFAQMSPSLHRQTSQRISRWLGSVSCLEGVKDVAKMLQALGTSKPAAVLEKFIPLLTSAALSPKTSDKIVEWNTRLLAGLIKYTGEAILPHLPVLAKVVRVALAAKEKDTRKAGSKLMRWMMSPLLSTYDKLKRSHTSVDWENPGSLWRKWGMPFSWSSDVVSEKVAQSAISPPGIQIDWHEPSEKEKAAALPLIDEYLVEPLIRLQAFCSSMADPSVMTSAVIKAESDKLLRDLHSVNAAVRGCATTLTDGTSFLGDDAILSVGTRGMALVIDPSSTSPKAFFASNSTATQETVSMRSFIHVVVNKVIRIVAQHKEFARDVNLMTILIELGYRSICARGYKMGKARSLLASVDDHSSHSSRLIFHDSQVSAFSKTLAASDEVAFPGPRPPPASFGAHRGIPRLTRWLMILRVEALKQLRVAELIYASPRSLHLGGGVTIGSSGSGQDDDAEDEDEISPIAVQSDNDDDTMSKTPDENEVPFGLDAAIPTFGRRVLQKLRKSEVGYTLLASAITDLSLHPYDKVRDGARSHVTPILSVLSWLRTPMMETAVARLDSLADDISLEHHTVFGLLSLSSLGDSGRGRINDWFSLDRIIHFLMRTPLILKGLPMEHHTEAMMRFAMAVERLLSNWYQLPIDDSHINKSHLIPTLKRIRSNVLQNLLSWMNPQAGAFLSIENSKDSFQYPMILSGTSNTIPQVMCSTGFRKPSQAPFTAPSPLHWRYELLGGALTSMMLSPSRIRPYRLAMDVASSRAETGIMEGIAPQTTPNLADSGLFAPGESGEALWLHFLSSSLSDSVLVRTQAIYNLMLLLHAHLEFSRESPRLMHALPRTRALLSDPLFTSQFIYAISSANLDQKNGSEGSSTDLALHSPELRTMVHPLGCPRTFVEFSRSGLRGGAQSSIRNMTLFEMLLMVFPEFLNPALAALKDLTIDGLPGTQASDHHHELVSIRTRQATLAEAFAGFMKVLSAKNAGASRQVTFSAKDCNIDEIARASISGSPDYDMSRVIAIAAPFLETVTLDWASDWTNAMRFAFRQRHPAQLEGFTRYVFANAISAIEGAQQGPPEKFESTHFESLLSLVSGGGRINAAVPLPISAAVPPTLPSPTPSSNETAASSSVLSFTSQARWLQFMLGLIEEFSASSDSPKGCSGAIPGVSFDEELNADMYVDPSPASLRASFDANHPSVSRRIATVALSRSVLPVLIRSLGHPYKACRDVIVRSINTLIECAWTPADLDINPHLVDPTRASIEVHVERNTGRVLEEPLSCHWASWVAPAVAAILNMSSSARSIASSIVASKDSSMSGGNIPTISDDEKWCHHVIESVILFSYYFLHSDAALANPVLIPMIPVIFSALNHPEKEVSDLAGVCTNCIMHSMILLSTNETDALYNVSFFKRVEALVLPSSDPRSTESGVDSSLTSMDLIVRLCQTYATADDDSGLTAGSGVSAMDASFPQLKSQIISLIAPKLLTASTTSSNNNTSWFVRKGVIDGVTPLRARHLLLLSHSQDDSLLNLVEARLDDKQIEVQEAASACLVGFVASKHLHERESIANRLLKLAATGLPKGKAPLVSADDKISSPASEELRHFRAQLAKAIRKRHAGCLGVAAVIQAQPFDVPPHLPAVIAALARHSGDPMPIGATVKKCVADFRRTHHDNWATHAAAFTEEQLSEVLAVGSGGSYFA